MMEIKKSLENRIEQVKAEIRWHRERIKALKRELKILEDTLAYIKEIRGE